MPHSVTQQHLFVMYLERFFCIHNCPNGCVPLQRVRFSSSLLVSVLKQQDFYERLIYKLLCIGHRSAVEMSKDHKLVLADDAVYTN